MGDKATNAHRMISVSLKPPNDVDEQSRFTEVGLIHWLDGTDVLA
ncbi:MAG: hypothetical protein V3T60_00100 [Candidatus Binatia bacterium]